MHELKQVLWCKAEGKPAGSRSVMLSGKMQQMHRCWTGC